MIVCLRPVIGTVRVTPHDTKINNQLTTRTDYESPGYMLLIEKLSALSERFYS